MPNTARRDLNFLTLEEAVHDAEQLLTRGYQRAGNWSLSQCCQHLAVLMSYPIDGFPPLGFPLNVASWMLRYTLAPRYLHRILTSGQWPPGNPTDKRTIAAPGGDEHQGVAALRHGVERLLAHDGPWQPSPLFGTLDKPTLIRLHCIHTAHHLSFLVPNED